MHSARLRSVHRGFCYRLVWLWVSTCNLMRLPARLLQRVRVCFVGALFLLGIPSVLHAASSIVRCGPKRRPLVTAEAPDASSDELDRSRERCPKLRDTSFGREPRGSQLDLYRCAKDEIQGQP